MKAQVLSFDLSTSVVFFLVIIAVVLAIITVGRSFESDPLDYELTFIFDNLERNLEVRDGQSDDAPNFLVNYRINYGELQQFESFIDARQTADSNNNLIDDDSIDDYTVGYVQNGHGIGLESGVYDSCLFLQDETGKISMNGKEVLGELKDGSCQDVIDAGKNPCEGYDQSLTLYRPVLLDYGNPAQNKIVQLNVVLCRV